MLLLLLVLLHCLVLLVEQAKNIATTKDSNMITVNIVVIIEVADSDACFICFEKNLLRLYARTQTKMISDVQVCRQA